MPWLSQSQERFLRAVNAVAAANPFLPELAEAERAALGREYLHQGAHWSFQVDDPRKLRANAWRICERLEAAMPEIRADIRNAGDAPGCRRHAL